jgi:hypothetical protein
MPTNWELTNLEHLLLHDKWKPYLGIAVLAGFDFTKLDDNNKANKNSLLSRLSESDEFYYFDCCADLERLTNLWIVSPNLDHLTYTPEFLINWALSKRFEPDWLDWAIEKGLVSNINKELLVGTKINQKELFDKDSSTYPLELDWAMQAWEAVRNDKSKRKPKAKIKAWLDANTQLSNEAKDRISIVVNWDKTGGATRTD